MKDFERGKLAKKRGQPNSTLTMIFQTAYYVSEYPLAPYELPHLYLVNVFEQLHV